MRGLFRSVTLYLHPCPSGIPVRTTNRPGAQSLGANGRDDGPVVRFFSVLLCFSYFVLI